MDIIQENALLNFYGWWQFAVCGFACAALLGIWYHIGRKQGDKGQVWLALSVLCWSFSGLVEIIYAQPIDISTLDLSKPIATLSEQLKQHNTHTYLAELRSILSLSNSLFILLALPWFRYIPKPIAPLVKSPYWYLIVGLPFLFSVLPIVSGLASELTDLLDINYAFFTVLFLSYVLWYSFLKRRLPILAGLSLVCIIVTIIAQLYKYGNYDIDLTLLSAIFKTALIMLFFALALSWVKELSESIVPDSSRLQLNLRTEKTKQGKVLRLVRVTGLREPEEIEVQLTPAHFDLLHRFVDRRTKGEGWLEIKPKQDQRSEKVYDINDHNQVKRLLNSLLDGIYGIGNWSKEKHHMPFRNALFEAGQTGSRKIRLRLPPGQLSTI